MKIFALAKAIPLKNAENKRYIRRKTISCLCLNTFMNMAAGPALSGTANR